MLRVTCIALGSRKFWQEDAPNFVRANKRRQILERKRIQASKYILPAQPTPHEVCYIYRQLFKKASSTLIVTDHRYFAQVVRYQMQITARQTSARVRGIMFEKGKWLLENHLGGVV